MEFNRGLLYHVESLEQDDTYGDYIIGRIPEAVRRQLNPKAQSNMLFVSISELRFVMEEDAVTIVLRRLPGAHRRTGSDIRRRADCPNHRGTQDV